MNKPAALALASSLSLILVTSAMAATPKDLAQNIQMRQDKIATVAAKRIENLAQKKLQIASSAATRKAELQKKLTAFKDTKKAATADRVNQNLNKINTQRTTQMTQHLDQMDKLVIKIDTRITELSGAGKDTSSAASASATAKTMISDARADVQSQALNDYTVAVTSEATVRADAKVMRDKLLSDLKLTHESIVGARASVVDVLKVLSTITGEKVTNGQ